jgi:capsular exopolysaccharide synthesis family protein
MSRVFEALERVSEEKESSSKTFGHRHENVGDKIEVRDGLPPDWHSIVDNPSLTMPHSQTYNGRKSWREMVEDFLYGWGVGRYKRYPIVVLEKESPAAQQYKILREQVKRLRGEAGARSLSVTSALKHDGKTMVAVNLSAAMALDYEEQVVLIDGDLRSPDIHHYFGMESSPGLADYLRSSSNGDLMNFVQKTFLPNLWILPAGKPSDFSSELLAKLKMKNLMEEIRSRLPGYQIIVDSPPVLSTPDPWVLAREVEGIVMVVRAGKTPRECLLKAIQSLNSNKLIGIVLNAAELGLGSKYYHYQSKNGT